MKTSWGQETRKRFLLKTKIAVWQLLSVCGFAFTANIAYADPISLIVGAISVIGTGFSVYSSYQQAKAQEGLANYNAAVARNNAILAKRDAVMEADKERYEGLRRVAAIKAAAAGGGLVSTAGSPILVAAEEAYQYELSAQKKLYAGEVAANNYSSQATAKAAEASAYGAQAGMELIGGVFKVAGSGLSAYGSYKNKSIE